MICKYCGVEIGDNKTVCPNCGKVIKCDETQMVKHINWAGLVGFILGLFSLFLYGPLSHPIILITSVVGLVLSSIGMEVRRKHTLNGFAIAGLVISIVALVMILAVIYASG